VGIGLKDEQVGGEGERAFFRYFFRIIGQLNGRIFNISNVRTYNSLSRFYVL
jgi:hypothetical protein